MCDLKNVSSKESQVSRSPPSHQQHPPKKIEISQRCNFFFTQVYKALKEIYKFVSAPESMN